MAAGASAGAAAASKRRRDQEEEEQMTPYGSEDLRDDWEFKIVRSSLGAFRKPEHLRRMLEEEARSGWVLVEKFDNSRVRLKRPASARKNDMVGAYGSDPYRTSYGAGDTTLALIIIAITIAVTALILLFVFLSTSATTP